ncbi:MAG: GntR family transcriptional regulator [Solirubrobacterales bacterium]|nr:GntR family transcriptional regulator [Solirubrobacterales bacterium]
MAQREAAPTPFQADPADELPVGVQLAWRLRALIAAGRLRAGERMPSVRALAQWAGVNVNTVRGVYGRLEDQGLIATAHGRGSFVAQGAPGSPEVERIAAEALAAAREAGVDPREVAIVALISAALPEALAEALPAELAEEGPDQPAELDLEQLAAELDLDDSWLEVDELAARRELRRQIGRLEAQLASYSRELESLAAETRPLNPPEPRIAGVAELERTRDSLLHQLATARGAATRRARRERRAREVRDAMVADPGAHRWEVVSAAETGEQGCLSWQVEPRLGPLGALMSWWQVKVSGGCPLPGPPAGGGERGGRSGSGQSGR